MELQDIENALLEVLDRDFEEVAQEWVDNNLDIIQNGQKEQNL